MHPVIMHRLCVTLVRLSYNTSVLFGTFRCKWHIVLFRKTSGMFGWVYIGPGNVLQCLASGWTTAVSRVTVVCVTFHSSCGCDPLLTSCPLAHMAILVVEGMLHHVIYSAHLKIMQAALPQVGLHWNLVRQSLLAKGTFSNYMHRQSSWQNVGFVGWLLAIAKCQHVKGLFIYIFSDSKNVLVTL